MPELSLDEVLRKSERGQLAIKTRDPALTVRARTLLIMVNGVKSARELAATMPDPEQARLALAELVSAGFAEPVGGAAPLSAAPASSAAAATPAPAAGPTPAAPAVLAPHDLKAAIQRASRLLYDALGPAAEPLCMKLEACRSGDEFLARLQECRRAVALARSEQKAQSFYQAAVG